MGTFTLADLNQADRFLTTILEDAWRLFWKDALVYIVALLLAAVVTTLSLGLLGGVMAVGFARMVRRLRAGESVGVLTVFSGFSHFVPATLATLVIAVGVTIGLFLLVIPGLFLLCAWSMTFVAMEAEDLSAGAALSRSYDLFKNHMVLVALLTLVLVVINAVAGTFVITAILAVPYTSIALVLAFEQMSARPLAQ